METILSLNMSNYNDAVDQYMYHLHKTGANPKALEHARSILTDFRDVYRTQLREGELSVSQFTEMALNSKSNNYFSIVCDFENELMASIRNIIKIDATVKITNVSEHDFNKIKKHLQTKGYSIKNRFNGLNIYGGVRITDIRQELSSIGITSIDINYID